MDQKVFEAELKKEGYEVMTNTTSGAKVNPEHSHPFDVRAMVLQGAMTLTHDGKAHTYTVGEIFSMTRGCTHFESYGPEGSVVLVGRKH
jgi:quercetin dioxygenase-like cupin family protein